MEGRNRGFGELNIEIDDEAIKHWATVSDGDARRALMALEIAVLSLQRSTGFQPVSDDAKTTHDADPRTDVAGHGLEARATEHPIHITLDVAEQSIQQKAIVYDRQGRFRLPGMTGPDEYSALGDDNDEGDDEDCVVITSPIFPGSVTTVDVTAVGGRGYLNAWADFDRNAERADGLLFDRDFVLADGSGSFGIRAARRVFDSLPTMNSTATCWRAVGSASPR